MGDIVYVAPSRVLIGTPGDGERLSTRSDALDTFGTIWTRPLVIVAADPHKMYFSHQDALAAHERRKDWTRSQKT